MDDFKRMDSLTQTKLTRAIEKAATLAMGSDQDRNKILAQQLKKDDVPKELTKTATAAFNRRLSVITLGARDQETKADNFSLADCDKVAQLRGCPSLQKKASVINAPFRYSISKPVMQKKASAEAQQPVKITIEQAMKKLGSLVDKTAIEFQQALYDLQQQEVVLQSLVKKASKQLNADIKTGNLLATVYGDDYKNIFKDKVDQRALQKKAAYAVLPKNMTVQLVEKTIHQSDVVNMKKQLVQLKKNAASILVQDAVAFQQVVNKLCLQGMSKKADLGDIPREALVNAITIPSLVLGGAAEGAASTASDYAKDISSLLSQRYAINPQSAITAKLMNTDRYDDKSDRLTDILADSNFKDYKVQDIQAAVSAAISQHPEFISPRYKEYLKTAVSNRLLAGGKTNTATQAAQAQMLKRIVQTDNKLKENSIQTKLKELKPVEGKDMDLGQVLPGIKEKETIVEKLLPAYNMKDSTKALSSLVEAYQTQKQQAQQRRQEQRMEGFNQYNAARDKIIQHLKYRQLKDLVRGHKPFSHHSNPELRSISRDLIDSIHSPSDLAKVLDTAQLQALQQQAAKKADAMKAEDVLALYEAIGNK